jgi:hypothetical protein
MQSFNLKPRTALKLLGLGAATTVPAIHLLRRRRTPAPDPRQRHARRVRRRLQRIRVRETHVEAMS